jgi:ribosomal protein S27AE
MAQDYSTNGSAITKHGSGKSLTGECRKCGKRGIIPKHHKKRTKWYTRWQCPLCGYTFDRPDLQK